MKKGALFWNEHDTKVFCEMCKEEVDAGNRLDEGYLSPAGYRNLELRFNSRTQRGYVKKHFKNRWNSLKLEYARWLELISSAGFGWDPETETFEADEDWWADHIRNNHWHAKFRNGPPDNLSLLEEIFGKAHVGESPLIPGEHLGEDKKEATRVSIDGSEEDAELTPCAMKKAKLAIPGEDLAEDKKMATPVNIDGPDEDAELTTSAMKKAKLVISGKDLDHEDKEVATRVDIDWLDKDAELPSAMKRAKLTIPGEDLAEDKEMAEDEDAELTPSATKRAKLSNPGEDLGKDKEVATPVNTDWLDKDAELPSAMKKAKLTIPGDDLGVDKEVATPINIDRSDEDAELTPSAKKKAKLSIPREDLAEDKEMATPVNIDEPDKDTELTPSAMEIAKSTERKVSSPMVAASTTKEDKNPVPQKYKRAPDDLTTSSKPSSCDSSTVPTIREAVGLIRECGVPEGTALFYTATKVVALNPEYRELFVLIRTREGRLDWLQRAHDDTTMRVHL